MVRVRESIREAFHKVADKVVKPDSSKGSSNDGSSDPQTHRIRQTIKGKN